MLRVVGRSALQRLLVARAVLGAGAGAPNRSAYGSAAALGGYLSVCARGLARPDPEGRAHGVPPRRPGDEVCESYAEHPETSIGRHLRCLAAHPATRSVAVLFYGNPCRNGVLSAVLGLRDRVRRGHAAAGPLVTADGSVSHCVRGREYLTRLGLAQYAKIRCGFVCPGPFRAGTLGAEDCLRDIRDFWCPSGDLDVLAVDFDVTALPSPILYQGLLHWCRPRTIVSANSGLAWQVYPWSSGDSLQGRLVRSSSSWFRFEDEVLHARSRQRAGPYRLAVDRAPSGMDFQAWQTPEVEEALLELGHSPPEPLRRFSVYVADPGSRL